MRNRDLLLLGAGLTGAFFFGLGALTIETSPTTVSPLAAPDTGELGPSAGEFGWLPAAVPQPPGNAVYAAQAAQVSAVAGPGEAGIWSLPAEFADPE